MAGSVYKIRPSGLGRIVLCPGSLQMSQDAPPWLDEYSDSTIREQGNACHWLAHETSQGRPRSIGTLAPNGVAITEEMQDACAMYFEAAALAGCSHLQYEVSVAAPMIAPNCGGTPDVAGVGISRRRRNMVFIGDLKYGFRTVDVWPNYQLITYGTAICNLMGWRLEETDFVFTIVQPRKWHIHGRVRSVSVTGAEVAPHVGTIQEAVFKAQIAKPPLVPGSHCDYCPGRIRCHVARDVALDFGFDTPVDLSVNDAETELQYLLEKKELLDARISGLSAQVQHALKNGARLKKFETVRTTGRLEWKPDQVEKIRALGRLMGAPIEKPSELITPLQAQKFLPVSLVNENAQRGQGANKLVPLNPSRWAEIFGKK